MALVNRKAVLLGTTNVGKTALAIRMSRNEFDSLSQPTLSGNSLEISCQDGSSFNLWDTAGQEKYKSLVSIYFQNAIAAIAVFDLNKPETLKPMEETISEFIGKTVNGTKIFIVGNKSDLEKKVEQESIDEIMSKFGNCEYHETSALNGSGVNELKESICLLMNNFKNSTPEITNIENKKQGDGSNCC